MNTEFHRVVVEVSGGVVQAVYSNPKAPILFVVIDHDNAEETAGRGGCTDRIVERETVGLEQVGFETFP